MEYLIYSVEDDPDIGRLINVALTKQGFQVVSFSNGEDFFKEFKETKPNMVLLDMMLPGISGSDILKKIRDNADNDEIDIIIVSANNMLMDKVDGLDLGADDYIPKPFDILELMSRVNAKARRHRRKRILTAKNIELDLDKHICTKDGEEVALTAKEFEILSFLFMKKDVVISREDIIGKLWGTDVYFETRTVDMHIKSLRQKLGDDLIKTIRGVGYMVSE